MSMRNFKQSLSKWARRATLRMGQKASRSTRLEADDIARLKETTHFTSKEIIEWHAKFHHDYPSGEITRREFIQMYQDMFPNGDARSFAEHIFRAYDADRNGSIDFGEFMATLSVSSKGTSEEKLRWAFRMYDLDGDGSVSMEEATEIIYAILRMREGDEASMEKANDAVEQLFRQLDKNEDHHLTEKEFVMAGKRSRAILSVLQAHK